MWRQVPDDVWSKIAMMGPVLQQVALLAPTLDLRTVAAVKIQTMLKPLRHRRTFQLGDRVAISRRWGSRGGVRYATVVTVAEVVTFRYVDKPHSYVFSEVPYETFRVRILHPWYVIHEPVG